MTKRDRAVKYFAKGLAIDEVAALLKSSEGRVRKWKSDPDFMDDVRRTVMDQADQSTAMLASGHVYAIKFMMGVLKDEDGDFKTRMTIADKIINYWYRNVGNTVISAEIERYLNELGSADGESEAGQGAVS